MSHRVPEITYRLQAGADSLLEAGIDRVAFFMSAKSNRKSVDLDLLVEVDTEDLMEADVMDTRRVLASILPWPLDLLVLLPSHPAGYLRATNRGFSLIASRPGHCLEVWNSKMPRIRQPG